MLDDVDLLICGAGPAGCVLAERAARVLGWKVVVVDRRRHIAGNCHDSYHASGLLVHDYGPHYFRTNDASLLDYLSRFSDWRPASYEVQSLVRGQLLPFPINLTTLERFFRQPLNAVSAERLLAARRIPFLQPGNSEEAVLSRVGRELYEAFYLNYTLKQWQVHPAQLEPHVCGRIPVRLDRRVRYVDDRFQVMPRKGFTALFARMLQHRKIRVVLDCDYRSIRGRIQPRRATVYTGPLDEYFDGRFGALPYRSLRFEFLAYPNRYRQPCVQLNFPNDFPYTRSVEFKHVTGQQHPETVIAYETPTSTGEPYYPVPMPCHSALAQRYRDLAEAETRRRQVFFCGRLAQYRYFNMDEVIQEALRCFQTILKRCAPGLSPFVLSTPLPQTA